MRLEKKFFLVFLLIAAIPILLITAVSYYRYFHAAHAQMDEYSHNILEKAVQQTNAALEDVAKAANMFAFYSDGANSLIQNLRLYTDSNEAPSNLNIYQTKQNMKYMCMNIANSYRFIYGLYVFTPCGIVFDYENTPTFKLLPDYDPTKEGWFLDTANLQGRLYISDISNHASMFSSSRESIFFSKYLYDVYSHKYLGILLVNCSPDMFDLDHLNALPDIVNFTLYNSHTRKMILGESHKQKKSVKTQALSSALNHPDLQLTASVNYQKLYKNFNLTGTILITIAVTALFIALILSHCLSRFLTRPIIRLSQIMAKQEGNTLHSCESYHSRRDEIGILYNEYNKMIIKLQLFIKTDYQNKLIAMDAQMKSLEACINSHFLFNTLSSINSIAVIEGSGRLSSMSIALGNMFRYAIKTKSELVTLEEELGHVNDYIAIQSIRFNNAFSYQTAIPDPLRKLCVLKLILQPLVENALTHGLLNCQAGSRIQIGAERFNSVMLITITDDGRGMDMEQLARLQASINEEPAFIELGRRNDRSIGIKNISTRIKLYYGEGYGLTIKSSKKEGTSVTIQLPLLEEGKRCSNISL